MAMVTGTWLTDLLLLVLSFLGVFYWYFTRTANYFLDRGIPYLPQVPIVGRFEVFTKSQLDLSKMLNSCFPGERFFGFFQTRIPILVVKDLDLIHNILVKDFAHFHDRGFPVLEHDAMTQNLFNLNGQKWRSLRYKLIPTFTTGKLKQMFDQVNKCGDNVLEDVKQIAEKKEPVEAKLTMVPFTLEVISSTAFGLDFSRTNPQTLEFKNYIKDVFDQTTTTVIRNLFLLIFPNVMRFFKMSVIPQDAAEYFFNLTKSTKAYRVKNKIVRNDYFQLLLTLQQEEEHGKRFSSLQIQSEISEEDKLISQMDFVPKYKESDTNSKFFTDRILTAQSFVFLTAGTESVSNTLSFILYHVAKDKEVQRKLTDEVDIIFRKHNSWTYQAVKECTYMDQVIQETQRMYPVLPMAMRECTAPYLIPGTQVTIEEGTVIAIPVGGIQMDPKYHPNPEVFNPDRFEGNNHKPNPTFLPFGDGPRICIGMRFAILEMKVSLSKILQNYNVDVDSKTAEPFTFDRKSIFPRPNGGIWLKFRPRSH